MGPEHLLDLQPRHLVAADLDDVHAVASENAVGAVFHDRDVPRAEPAVAERLAGRFGAPPVFEEDAAAPHLDLAGSSGLHGAAVLVHQADLDARKRCPHEPRAALT